MARYILLGVLGLVVLESLAHAVICTEADIRQSVQAGLSFDYRTAGCENPSGRIEISNTIDITRDGVTVDGQKRMKLVWVGPGECNKLPTNYAAITIRASRVVLKNFEVLGAPDGLHVNSGSFNVIDGVVFPYVCEDAITNGNKKPDSATNTVIRNSAFYNSDDKAIQVNGGSVRVENSYFENVFRAIGACASKADPGWHEAKPCPVPTHIEAIKNTVIGCKGYSMRAAGKAEAGAAGTLRAISNRFRDCAPAIQAEEDGQVYAAYNDIRGVCKFAFRTFAGGSIKTCGNTYSCQSWKEPSSNVVEKCE